MPTLHNKKLSNHAETRLQQRGISGKTLDYLHEYGEESYAPGDATRITLSRRVRDKIIQKLKRDIQMLEQANRIVEIQKDGLTLTAYKR